jgi:hypothetical protein
VSAIYIPLPNWTYFTDFQGEGNLQLARLPQLQHLEAHREWLNAYEDLFPPSPQPSPDVQPAAPHDLFTSSEHRVDEAALSTRILRPRQPARRTRYPGHSSSSSSDGDDSNPSVHASKFRSRQTVKILSSKSVHFQEGTDEDDSAKCIPSSTLLDSKVASKLLPRTARMQCQQIVILSSSSSDSDIKDSKSSESNIANPIPSTNLPPQRTARMQCKQSVHLRDNSNSSFKGESSSSSNDTDDSQPSKVPKHSTTSKLENKSKSDMVFFEAKTLEAAKSYLIAEFHAIHAGAVLPTGRNSRPRYVAVFCKKCNTTASASLTTGTTWRSALKSKVTKCRFGQPSASHSTTAIPASSPVMVTTLVTCSFCADDIPTQDAIACHMGLHHYCSVCFGNHVNTLCGVLDKIFQNDCAVYCVTCKETNVTSNFNMQELVSRWVYTVSYAVFDFFMQSFRLSTEHYNRYASAVAEKKVKDALVVADQGKPNMDDVVQMALYVLFKPDSCPNPNCKVPYEHSGDCAAMTCDKCHAKFCLYCRKIITAVGAQGRERADELSGLAHSHVLDCPKRPLKNSILSATCLYPSGSGESNGSFVQAFFMTRKLDALKEQIRHWTVADVKRLVLNKDFQELLADLQKKKMLFRGLFPEKPQLLRFAFHRMIRIQPKFDFELAMQNAWWFTDHDDPCPVTGGYVSGAKPGTLERRIAEELAGAPAVAARPAVADAAHPAVAARPARFPYQQQLATLVSMGFDTVLAEQALEASAGNVDLAIGLFLAPE